MRGDLVNTYKYLKEGGRQMGEARLFLMVCSNSTRSNGLELVNRKFHTDMQKNFMVRVMEHWNRLPREVVRSPSLETLFKTCLDVFPCGLI